MNQKICILPDHRGVGGPASFRERIISGLTREGCLVATNPLEAGVTAILVIGGTRRIDQLWQARRKWHPNRATAERNELGSPQNPYRVAPLPSL